MSYAKAMKHYRNPRKWKRTRTIDSRGMAASGRRANALIFGEPKTEASQKARQQG